MSTTEDTVRIRLEDVDGYEAPFVLEPGAVAPVRRKSAPAGYGRPMGCAEVGGEVRSWSLDHPMLPELISGDPGDYVSDVRHTIVSNRTSGTLDNS